MTKHDNTKRLSTYCNPLMNKGLQRFFADFPRKTGHYAHSYHHAKIQI